MKQFQWLRWAIIRRYGGYVKVSRPSHYKTVLTPSDESLSLGKALHMKISASGPITVADYMKTCLSNPSIGYYMQKDIIGEKGDFITSPEICQIFGEILGVWIVHELRKIGSPKPWQLIELGPGKGTLMKDVLRTLEVFKATENLSVHMVEISRQLSTVQAHTLCNVPIPIGMVSEEPKHEAFYKQSTTHQNVPVFWYEKLEKVPKAFSVVLAHEFFDALPIHKFQKVNNEWREILINSSVDKTGKYKFEYVVSQKESPLSKLLIQKNEKREHVEVCSEAGIIAGHLAKRLEEFGGFSLFIDYGHNGEKTDTFRAFKKHQLIDPLENPGTADLTADVDFSFLNEVMKDKLVTFGPVEQGDFLERMGIKLRLNMLLKDAKEDVAKALRSGCEMITSKDRMGSRYKVFAAFPLVLENHLKRFPVAGFS